MVCVVLSGGLAFSDCTGDLPLSDCSQFRPGGWWVAHSAADVTRPAAAAAFTRELVLPQSQASLLTTQLNSALSLSLCYPIPSKPSSLTPFTLWMDAWSWKLVGGGGTVEDRGGGCGVCRKLGLWAK